MFKQIIKSLVPPILMRLFRQKKQVKWSGRYDSWESVASETKGYSSNNILERVSEAILMIREGRAVYERDGAIFDKVQYNWPLLTSIGVVLAKIDRTFSVVDFGGSLGSIYFQNKWFFGDKVKSWVIVEQENFVKEGRKRFEDGCLCFVSGLEEITARTSSVDLLLLSSVLQYLESPFSIMDDYIKKLMPAYILVDRTSTVKVKSFISRQDVVDSIVASSYPINFFNDSELVFFFEKYGYTLLFDFASAYDPHNYIVNRSSASWKGFFFKKND